MSLPYFKKNRTCNAKVFTLLLLFLIFNFKSQSQTRYNLELKVDKPLKKMGFACSEIIDKRKDKENFGVINKVAKKKIYLANFEEPLEAYLKTYMNSLLASGGEKDSLVFIIHSLVVKEAANMRACYIELELARERKDSLYSLGIFESLISGGGKSKSSHARRVEQVIENCLVAFKNSGWVNNFGELIDIEAPKYEYDYTKIPPFGAYMSFGQLARNKPLDEKYISFVLNEYESTKFRLISTRKELNNHVKYISDGQNVFLSIGKQGIVSNAFVKSKHLGRYMYFEEKVQDSRVPIAPSLGVVGVAPALLIKKKIALVLDTQQNVVKILDELLLYRLTKKDHPEILSEYKKSSRKLEDLEKAIVDLNAKY